MSARSSRRWRGALVLAFLTLAVLTAAPPAAAQPAVSEYDVKAAFLYNFTKFVEWPPGAFEGADRFVIGVFGDDPFGPLLGRTFAGKTVQDRAVVIRRIDRLSGIQNCHILFVSADAEAQLPQILRALEHRPVLTVGETDEFMRRGGVIAFGKEGRKVRFEINQEAAERAGLSVSSQLLKLATHVKTSE